MVGKFFISLVISYSICFLLWLVASAAMLFAYTKFGDISFITSVSSSDSLIMGLLYGLYLASITNGNFLLSSKKIRNFF